MPRPEPKEGDASEKVDARAQRVEELRSQLLTGVPDAPADRNDEQHARWLLAYLLDWHRREDKAGWWEYFRLRELPEEDLFEEPQAVAGLQHIERVELVTGKKGKPTGSVVDRYRYPVQEMEIRRKGRAEADGRQEVWRGDPRSTELRCTIDVRKGPSQADIHPTPCLRTSTSNSACSKRRSFELDRESSPTVGSRVGKGKHDPVARSLLLRLAATAPLGRLLVGAWRIRRRLRRAHRRGPGRDRPRHPGTAGLGQDLQRRAR